MVREIKKYPDPVLQKKCPDINQITQSDKDLIRDMKQTMYQNEGVGLAAPQVGVCRRLIVVDVGDGAGLRVFINPEIKKAEGKASSEEGCLSVPGVSLKVNRAEKIELEALNREGERFNLEAEGFLAYAIQHEIDHLNGILILDKVNTLERIKRKFF